MTDSLTSNTTPKSLGVIDTISEVSRNLFSLKLFGKPQCEIIALNSSTHFTSYYKFSNIIVNGHIFVYRIKNYDKCHELSLLSLANHVPSYTNVHVGDFGSESTVGL